MSYKNYRDMQTLIDIMARLRAEGGCPWDREQTHDSLRRYLIEESYEVLDAIERDNKKDMCEELGDLLLQVVFHAQIAQEEGEFTINDVIEGICKKMVHRHPHVFSDKEGIESPDDVMEIWEDLKRKEGKEKAEASVLKMPKGFPALLRAQKLQEKAARVGFDWPIVDDVWAKLEEEVEEAKHPYSRENEIEEVGDMLFAMVNVARFLDVNSELALSAANDKFSRRFEYIENKKAESGKNWQDLSLKDLDDWWNEIKSIEKDNL